MRLALLQITLATIVVVVGGDGRLRAAAPPGPGTPPPTFYVKDGDQFRPARDDELKTATAHDDHAHGGGLSFTGIHRWDLGLYTLIVFGLLIFILSRFAWPHIRAGLEKREANILAALEQAKKDRADAEARLAEAKKQLHEAAQQAAAILAEARRDAEVLKATEIEKGQKEAQAERERAKRDVEIRMDAMRKELRQEVVELALLIATKALRRQVTIDNHHQLLDEAIAELNTAGHLQA
ncbi:MAG: F0F1 ATP synthase subunit B [Gemmataceae bacterium]|nr:F0F1 ATP synthase subunit B [Gemmata sp.]MDW8198979.1 F0F1 ATP synthase subunit B [Gemmataceae bacterium]